MTKFPSVEWFQALSERAAADKEEFKRLGYFDANVGVKIDANGSGARGYVLEFAGYGVRSVKDVADPVAESNFTIVGSLDAWTDMVRNIQDHGEPDLNHTLNRLTMAGVPMKVVAKDQLEVDLFYRFNQTLQAFFNEAAALPTEFAHG